MRNKSRTAPMLVPLIIFDSSQWLEQLTCISRSHEDSKSCQKISLPLKQNILDIYLKSILQVHIVYMGEKYHNDLKLVTDSHLDLLASVVGRYASSTNFFFFLVLDLTII